LESLVAWSVSDDQQVSILGEMSEQFDGPDQVVDSFLSCESSDCGHEGCIVWQVELVADFASQAGMIRSVASERYGPCVDPVGDHFDPLGRHSHRTIELGNRLRVGQELVGPSDQSPVDPQLPASFPAVDAAFRDDDTCRWAGGPCDSTVGVGGKQPGVQQVGASAGEVLSETSECLEVEPVSFADDRQWDLVLGQFGFQRPAARERNDLDLKFVSRQATGE